MRAQHGHLKYFITLLVGVVVGLNVLTMPAWSGEVGSRPPSVTPSNSARPIIVQGVNVRPDGGKLIIDLQTNGTPVYKSFELENPRRVVVDVENAVLETEQHHFPVDHVNIRSVRLAQFSSAAPQIVRAVITFRNKVPYAFSRDGNAIRMLIDQGNKGVETASKPPLSALAAKTEKPSTAPAGTRLEKTARTPDRGSIQNPTPKRPSVVKPETGPLVASLKPTVEALPKVSTPKRAEAMPAERKTPLEKQKTVDKPAVAVSNPANAKPVAPVESASVHGRTRPVPQGELGGKPVGSSTGGTALSSVQAPTHSDKAPVNVAAVQPPSPAPPAQNMASLQSVPPAAQPAPTPAPQAAASTPPASAGSAPGDIISLDLRDVDIRDFFRLIHEVSGLNVILDPSVRGTLTIALKDVPWEQALRIVLLNNQLTSKLEGNVLRIVTLKGAEDESVAERKMKEAQVAMQQVQVEPKKTFTRVPNYMKAEDLRKVFEQLLGKGSDLVYSDKDTNTILVRTTQRQMDDLDAIMKKMDIKKQQVEIEARVVTANRSFLRDLGVQLGAQLFSVGANGPRNILTGSPVPGLNSPNIRQPRPPISSAPPATQVGQPIIGPLPFNINLGAAAPTSSLGYVFNGANALIDAFITASESKGLAKLLSKPKIITRNHEEGEVNQGTKIPIQTVVNNTVSTVYINAVLDLTVTPHITEEGTIFLDVKVTRDTPDFNQSVNNIPTIQTQFLQTKVLLNDGGTVVVGGVLVDDNEYSIRQVPGLGNLPIIGNAFRNKSLTQTTNELLFFLTPKIIQ
ncbi:MAG: type IV pilus secretin PilQ [Terriglobia bacterium]